VTHTPAVPSSSPRSVSDRAAPWWRDAVIYQVYIRSFADGNGDGIGDISGLRARLSYLRDLGIDAIWINPWYRSPMFDAGYDVADYRNIDSTFGTLAQADELIRACHRQGIRVIVDLVPNHTSAHHPWFRAALSAPPESSERGIGFGLAEAWTAGHHRTIGAPGSVGARGRACRIRIAQRVNGTCICLRRSSRTSTGTTRRLWRSLSR